ncbi:hypothetical protein HNP84_009625 [Thermocatellispora tengchongensis]|uniref:Uncharacterized protein n=1 Tax=Thermocatellispora tengchongensis TaxID=1073253 RepID=A0A840PQ15_9ACTN|nr:hypothetical protein [Thermocatellispora tengchongensis]MBB5139861.1 hypothetical protein [Thermocatellispora tengchongensis]
MNGAASYSGADAALIAAWWLLDELKALGVGGEVIGGYGLAVVPVWTDLLVWTDGQYFWWRLDWNARTRRYSYAWHSVTDPERAARRVAFRLADLRNTALRVTSAVGPEVNPSVGGAI